MYKQLENLNLPHIALLLENLVDLQNGLRPKTHCVDRQNL
jgi:hypothetical protein